MNSTRPDASPDGYALRGLGSGPPHVTRPTPCCPPYALGYSISLTSLSTPSLPLLAPPSRRPPYADTNDEAASVWTWRGIFLVAASAERFLATA
jgi:hypothetical protein